jgi:DNA repair protein RecN (Recombination protein N)
VAACADHHLLVSKQRSGRQTVSTVQALAEDGRVSELARMLGGNESSAVSLAHARELLAG